MDKYPHLHIEAKDKILSVRLNRPKVRNALNLALMQELRDFAYEHRYNTDYHAIILTGGEGFFSAGADLGGFPKPENLMEWRIMARLGGDMCQAWEDIEAITLVAVEGYCIGGGCALSVACDFRIMAHSATMRLPEVPLGMNMSWRALPRLTTLMGPARTKRFTIFGESISAQTCLEWGLADAVVPDATAYKEAYMWAEKICALPPLPVRMSKESINAHAHALNHASAIMDRDQYLLTQKSEDLKEGVRAFFEKRSPKFTGD